MLRHQQARLTIQPALHRDFATFDATASKLVTVTGSQLYLRGLDGKLRLPDPLPPATAGALATHPEISPDNTRLANVEFTGGGYDAQALGGSIVIRSFDATANKFGAPTVLVPSAAGVASWYPSFSPDGEWSVFTRTTNDSYNDASAETWLVKAGGTQPPIQLAAADLTGNLTNSWARWVPFSQTFGPDNQKLFYRKLTSSRSASVPGFHLSNQIEPRNRPWSCRER